MTKKECMPAIFKRIGYEIKLYMMSWSPFISSDNVVAIHAILVPTTNGDGEILKVGGDNHSYAD